MDYYSRVLVSDSVIVDVVDCKAFVCKGDDLPTKVHTVRRHELRERTLGWEQEQKMLGNGLCLLGEGYDAHKHLAKCTLK